MSTAIKAKPRPSFEEAISPLMFLIKHELDLAHAALNNKEGMAEAICREISSKQSLKIIESLSEEYFNELKYFFTEDAIINFITESFTHALITKGVSLNMTTARKNYEADIRKDTP